MVDFVFYQPPTIPFEITNLLAKLFYRQNINDILSGVNRVNYHLFEYHFNKFNKWYSDIAYLWPNIPEHDRIKINYRGEDLAMLCRLKKRINNF